MGTFPVVLGCDPLSEDCDSESPATCDGNTVLTCVDTCRPGGCPLPTNEVRTRPCEAGLVCVANGTQSGARCLAANHVLCTSEPIDALTMTAADLDGDGSTTLVATRREKPTAVFATRAGEDPADILELPASSKAASALVVADFNGDRVPDVLAVLPQPNATELALFIGEGGRRFHALRRISVDVSPDDGGDSIRHGDLDEDGVADLALLGSNGKLVVFFGGSIPFARQRTTRLEKPPSSSPSRVLASRLYGFTDVDGDGHLDAIVGDAWASFTNAVYVIPGDGEGGFRSALARVILGDVAALHIADLDGDGIDDLVTIDRSDGLVRWSRGARETTFPAMSILPLPPTHAPQLVLQDVDGDRIADIIVDTNDGALVFARGRRSAREPFDAPRVLAENGREWMEPISAGDFGRGPVAIVGGSGGRRMVSLDCGRE